MSIYRDMEVQQLYLEYIEFMEALNDEDYRKPHDRPDCNEEDCDGHIEVDFELIYWLCVNVRILQNNIFSSGTRLTEDQQEAFIYLRNTGKHLSHLILKSMGVHEEYEVVIKA